MNVEDVDGEILDEVAHQLDGVFDLPESTEAHRQTTLQVNHNVHIASEMDDVLSIGM